jgi:hypothetical protein
MYYVAAHPSALLTQLYRLIFIFLYRLTPTVLDAATIVRPETMYDGVVLGSAPSGAGSLDHGRFG